MTPEVPMDPLLARRYSGRAYDPGRRIAPGNILALLDAARWAPSCYGDQPWNYIVCDRHEDETAWQAALQCIAPGNQDWAKHAPLLLLAVACHDFRQRATTNRWAQYDTGAASMALALQAVALGLMAHQMGGFDEAKTRAAFAVPEDCMPMAFIAAGYPLPESQWPEALQARERAPRTRLPRAHNFFSGKWGCALKLR